MTTQRDFALIDAGNIFLLDPLTPAAEAWVEEHLPADRMEWVGAVVVEHRYVNDILKGIASDGLTLS